MLPVTESTKHSKASLQTRSQISIDKNETDSFLYIRKALRKRGISEAGQNIIIKSWRESTRKQYDTYIKKWIHYCERETGSNIDTVNSIIGFLTSLHEQGLSYTAINTARSALSNFMRLIGKVDIHEDTLVSRFMKGIFNEKPPLPKYKTIWDAKVVLQYLETMNTQSLVALSCKLCMLFLLVTAQRCQTLHVLKLSDIHNTEEGLVINISAPIKQTRGNYHIDPIFLKTYGVNNKLCIVTLIKEYIRRTECLRTGDNLLVSTIKPHGNISKQTVSRWIKITMKKAGIEEIFKPHSTRAAATSQAYNKGVPLSDIIKTAGWSNAKTFATFYQKEIMSQTNKIQDSVLQ